MSTHHFPDKSVKHEENFKQRIIVIGTSTGGFDAMKKIVRNLPEDFQTPIFVVWHMSAHVHGVLPQVLNRENKIFAAHAYDKEPITPNRIYVAPPDNHLLVENGTVRLTRGPKENRFRPAIDPLFRSAAYAYDTRVIGIVLSGALDDGTAGLWTIKKYGGIAIVQDPDDAEMPSMPESALREVEVDYCVPVNEIADLLVRLVNEPIKKIKPVKDAQTKKEIEISSGENTLDKGEFKLGKLSPYACPECHGVLSELQNDNVIRFRCHTGHAYSIETLVAAISEKIEDSLYNVLRGMDENVILLNHIGDHYAENNLAKLAAAYFLRAREVSQRSELVRNLIRQHEQMSKEKIDHIAEKHTANLNTRNVKKEKQL